MRPGGGNEHAVLRLGTIVQVEHRAAGLLDQFVPLAGIVLDIDAKCYLGGDRGGIAEANQKRSNW